jgi:hypothetical protein
VNPVTVGLVLLLGAAGYVGFKFIPPYWQAQKVDNALSTVKWEVSKLPLYDRTGRADVLLERLKTEVIAVGVDEQYLRVYFEPDYTSVHADYYVFVHHPFGKMTTLEFRRSIDIPRDVEY